MKTFLRTLLIPVLSFLFVGTMVLPAAADQPRMTAALELLHKAQGAREPIPFLRAAKKELEKAEENKGGFRAEAIKLIDGAIAEGEAGRPVKMEERIAAAITAVHDGIEHAR